MRLRVHPSSVLWRVATPCVLFYQAQQGEFGWYDLQARTPARLQSRFRALNRVTFLFWLQSLVTPGGATRLFFIAGQTMAEAAVTRLTTERMHLRNPETLAGYVTDR